MDDYEFLMAERRWLENKIKEYINEGIESPKSFLEELSDVNLEIEILINFKGQKSYHN